MARDYSRAYWRHLVKSGEILAMMGLTAINLAYYQDLMAGARRAIDEGRLDAYIEETGTRLGRRRGGRRVSRDRRAEKRIGGFQDRHG